MSKQKKGIFLFVTSTVLFLCFDKPNMESNEEKREEKKLEENAQNRTIERYKNKSTGIKGNMQPKQQEKQRVHTVALTNGVELRE